jgi:hypothetical protein
VISRADEEHFANICSTGSLWFWSFDRFATSGLRDSSACRVALSSRNDLSLGVWVTLVYYTSFDNGS